MRGRPVRPLPARAGVPLQGRPRLRAPRARSVLSPGDVLIANQCPSFRSIRDEAMTYHETTTGRLQVRIVRRLPALAPGLRGPVAGRGRPGRDRLFPGGDPPAARGRIRRGPGRRLGLHARAGGGDPRHPPPQPILDHTGSLCIARRDSGPAEFRQPERRERPGDRVCLAAICRDAWPARGRPAPTWPSTSSCRAARSTSISSSAFWARCWPAAGPRYQTTRSAWNASGSTWCAFWWPTAPRAWGRSRPPGAGCSAPVTIALAYSCFGPSAQPNTAALARRFEQLGLKPEEIRRLFQTFYANAHEFKEAGLRHVEPISTAG